MIVNNACLVTRWRSQPRIEGALLATEGKSIVDFGPVGKLVDRYDDQELLDVRGRLLVPGMIDAHSRLHRSLFAAVPAAWSASLRIEEALEHDSLYWSALASLVSAIRSGITTVFAAVSSPRAIEGSLAAIEPAFREAGVRGSLAYLLSPRSDRSDALRESLRHIESCRGASSEWMQGMVGLEASSALDEGALEELARAAEGAGARIHVLLGEEEEESVLVERLGRAGVWNAGGLAVCRGPLSPADEGVLREHEVWVVHGAQSDILSGMGALDLRRAKSAGVRLALGTDGVGTSLLEEFRIAAYRQRTRGRELKEAVRLAYRAAFAGNSELATRTFGRELGRIKPGARADLVVLDYRPAASFEEDGLPEEWFWGASRAPVWAVIVNGRLLYQNGTFLTLDEERIHARAKEAARKLRERL